MVGGVRGGEGSNLIYNNPPDRIYYLSGLKVRSPRVGNTQCEKVCNQECFELASMQL